jgi:Flp pilus assembly protein TadD
MISTSAMDRRFLFGSLFLVAAIFIVYLPAIHGRAIWDDEYMLTANPVMSDPHGLWRIFFDLAANKVFYPVTLAVLWLECRAFGLADLTGYHAVNALIHSANAILLWRLLRRLDVRGAFVIAAIWGLHPVDAESVAYITEHKNTVSGLFYLLTMGALLRYFGVIAGAAAHRGRWYLAALVLFAAALGAKSTAVTLPAAALLLVWWKSGRITRGNLWAILPFVLLAGASGSLTQYIETHTTGEWQSVYGLSPVGKILVAGRALFFYTGKLLWPTRLAFTYPRWIPDPSAAWQWVFPVAFAAVVTALWLCRHRIGRGPLVGVLFFCGTLVPALGFFHVLYQRYSFVADHFQYMASMGMIAVLVGSLAQLKLPRRVEIFASALLILLLMILTARSSRRFQSDESVWATSLWFDGGNPLANLNYATDIQKRGQLDEAIPYLRRSAMSPMLIPNVCIQMGENSEARGNYPLALRYYGQATELASPEPLPHLQYGTMLLVTGQLPAAAGQLRMAIQLDPEMAEAYDNLGVCLLRMGDPAGARREFETAMKLQPALPLVRKHLAEVEAAERKTANP